MNMNRSFSLVLATLALFPAQLRAEEPVIKTESVAVMDEVVVTATKTEEKRRDIANSVVTKDALEIAESPAQSLGALLANEPGLDWRTYGNYGGAAEGIQIRGMDAKGTLVVVDGVVVNSPSLGSADVGQISLNSIEKIEVVKGPGSLLYGSGAMGGTVSIISKKPSREGFKNKVEAGYGSENNYHLAAESGGFVSGDFGYYLTVNRNETDGFRDNSDLTKNDVTLNLMYDKGERFNGEFNFGYVQRDYGIPGAKPPTGAADKYINGEHSSSSESVALLDRGKEHNRHSSLTLKGKAGEMLNWRLKGDCAVLINDNHSRASYGGGDSTVTNTVRGVEANFDLNPTKYLGLLAGNEYRNFDYENEYQVLDVAGAPVAGGQSSFKAQVFTNGTFAELSLRPIEQVKLIAGTRYETHSAFGHKNVTRYGLVVSPLADTAIKVNRGQVFKAPTPNDLYWPGSGNPALKPETGWNTDVTVEQGLLDGKVFATVSWFKWDINDKIDWASTDGIVWTPSNVNSAQATGWEGEVKIGPYYGLRGAMALTLLDAKEEASPGATRDALNTSDIQGKFGISHYADFGLTSTMTARYVGSRPGYYASKTALTPKFELDPYCTVDLKLEQELAAHWRLALLATNLLDEEYDTYQTSVRGQAYPGKGRSLFASVGYSW